MTEEERRAMHRQRRLDRDKKEEPIIANFKKQIGIKDGTGCDQDMLKCSACGRNIGIKKWARIATADKITCPRCGATADAETTATVIPKEKSRFKVTKVESGKSSVEIREDGSRLIKEEIHVAAKSVAKKD